jgi:predicted enzyme related to lactoylglutathione lyase
MSALNTKHNRTVWIDIPVADLERSAGFYRAVLGVGVTIDSFQGSTFGVLEHQEGNGGCLVHDPSAINSSGGILVYLNVDGRIHDAVAQAVKHGGRVLEAAHSMGPHGCRAIIVDSEGNRLALHSTGTP